jgi:hypothetical protein
MISPTEVTKILHPKPSYSKRCNYSRNSSPKTRTIPQPPAPTLPLQSTASTRHRSSSDTGLDILGWKFREKALGPCTVIATDTLLDDNNILWNTMQIASSKTQDTFVAKVIQPRQAPQFPTCSAILSPQTSAFQSKSTTLSEPSFCHHAAFRLPVSAYQRKVPETNDDDSEPTPP